MDTKHKQLIEIINNGFYNVPKANRDEWLKSNHGISYRAFYNRMKKFNIKIQKTVSIIF